MVSDYSCKFEPLAQEDPPCRELQSVRAPSLTPLNAKTCWALLGTGILLVVLWGFKRPHPYHTNDMETKHITLSESTLQNLTQIAENKICEAGSVPLGDDCVKCHAGRFAPARSITCNVCPAGRFASAGSTACSRCPAGRYSFTQDSTCKPCPKENASNTHEGSQCNINLCGHTCAQVVFHIMQLAEGACDKTWATGCPDMNPAAPFDVDSKLSDMCARECEKVNDTQHEEIDSLFVNANNGYPSACRGQHSNDDDGNNFIRVQKQGLTLKSCKQRCVDHGNCTGIEFNTFWSGLAHCELWLVPIDAVFNETLTEKMAGFMCYRYNPTAAPIKKSLATQTRGNMIIGVFLLGLVTMLI